MSTAVELSGILVNTINLSLQVRSAHWNVEGEHFLELHRFFGDTYDMLSDHADTVAERIRYLQAPALGDITSLADLTSLPAFNYDLVGLKLASDMLTKLRALSYDLNIKIAKVIVVDNSSADILIKLQQDVDKAIFFLQSMLIGELEDEDSAEESD